MRLRLLLALLLVLALAPAASADFLFDFSWTSTFSYWTSIPVFRTNPDGSVTPYDDFRYTADPLSGHGTLSLGPGTGSWAAYAYTFDGAGGSGGGTAGTDGTVGPEAWYPRPSIDYASLPKPLEDLSGGVFPNPYNVGFLTLTGDPADPSGVGIAIYEGSSPHCWLQGCWRREFDGTGTRIAETAEPLTVALVGLGLFAALGLRRRTRG